MIFFSLTPIKHGFNSVIGKMKHKIWFYYYQSDQWQKWSECIGVFLNVNQIYYQIWYYCYEMFVKYAQWLKGH